jgi:hypothetical protein
VPEIENDTVRIAVLERDSLDPRGVGPAEVLDGVDVRSDMVVL